MSKHWLQYTFRLFFVIGIGLFLPRCDGDQSDQSNTYSEITNLLTASLSTLPQLQEDIDLDHLLTINIPDSDNDGDQALITQFNDWLTFQCHLPNSTLTMDYCPEDTSLLTSNTYSPRTLQGLVATAFERIFTIYPNDKSHQTCENSTYTSEIEGQGAFSPEESRDLSLLQEDTWACLEQRKGDHDSQTYTLFSKATDRKTYAMTHVSLDAQTSDYTTNALVDAYARKNQTSDDQPVIVAWNIILAREAQANTDPDQSSRLILILNTQTGNYIGKYGEKQREGQSTELYAPSQDWVILGRGGFDAANQVFTQGQYSFRGRLINPDDDTYYTRQYCIYNDATPSFATTENCLTFEQELTDFFDHNDGFWDSQTMVNFLGLTSEDQSQLSLWSEFLDGPGWMELSDLPTRSKFPSAVNDDTSEDDQDDDQ